MLNDVRKNSMMTHLLDSLDRGEDIGHYGRLVFLMVARHFATDDEFVAELSKDSDFSDEQARELLAQVKAADYNPPKREKILDFASRQEFPIVTDPENPDSANVYKDLEFPEHVYAHISEYREAKTHA